MRPMAWKKIHHQIQRIYLGSKWHNDASHNVFWWSFWVPPTYRPQGWWKNPPNDRGYQTMQICMVLLGDLNGFALENAMFGLVIHHDPWFNLEIDDISRMPCWTFFKMPLVGLLEWEEWYWQIHGELFFWWMLQLTLVMNANYFTYLSWYIHTTIWRLYDMYYMTTHHFFKKKTPGLPGVPFTFSLSESPWTPERSWLYPVRWPQKCWFWSRDFLSLLLTVRHGNLLEPGRSEKNLGILIWSRNASKILSTYCPYCTSQLVFFKIISLKWKSQVLKSLFLPRANGRSTPIKILRGRWSSTQ